MTFSTIRQTKHSKPRVIRPVMQPTVIIIRSVTICNISRPIS